MGLLGRRSRMAVTVGVISAVFALTAEAPAWAATTTVPDRTFPANAATLADVATSIRAEAAYTAGYTGKGVGIALIDTGVVPVQGLTSGNVVNGPDLSLESQVTSLRSRDGYGHGTHMAGIIAGRDNTAGTGFRGIAPDARLTSIKVGMSNGAVDVTQMMAAIDWVVAHRNDDPGNPIRVLNLSYGLDCTNCSNSPVAVAVGNAVKAGIMVVVAAGNTGAKITVPATSIEPIVVGSLDTKGTTNPADDTVSSFSSNDGRVISLDVLAPGRSVVSLRDPGSYADTKYPSARVGTRYMKGSGTSQAAAVTSGAIALYLQKNPRATIADVRNAIWSLGSGILGAPGKLDVGKMLAYSATTSLSTQTGGTIGTIQASRGSSSVYFGDNTPLSGERDIFGPLTVSDWAAKSASQTSWSGGSWMGHPYTGTTWTSTADGQGTWAGVTWSGRAWSGRAWSDVAWAGRSWSGSAWAGASITGSAWSGTAWSGALWQ
jgi:serine protease AprX